MKTSCIAVLLAFVALAAGTPSAQAACACVCIEGQKRSVCNDMTEASEGQNVCLDGLAHRECPTPDGEIDSTVQGSTPEGAVDCQRARAWDPAIGMQGGYKIINVCGLAG